ncbi:MAG: hypothetical protein Q4Q53_04365 [Methanocorpusculum sp.]|nr:hypothetical protein [Methanocorpusculum sp.]
MFLSRPEKKAVIILTAVIIALAVLFFVTTFLIEDRGAVEYSENLSDGTLVKYEGTVYDTKITSTGGHLIANVSGVTVFIYEGGSSLFLMKGDRVKVIGKTETYSGRKEIAVERISDINILTK